MYVMQVTVIMRLSTFCGFLNKLIGWLAMYDSCMNIKAHDQLKL